LEISVGALGKLIFEKGRYVYVGSGLNGLKARVRRHLNTCRGVNMVCHWHIDYLLREKSVNIISIYIQITDKRIECIVANETLKNGRAIEGFGSSDCKCLSHLFQVKNFYFLSNLGLKRKNFSDFLK
jgi:Uri superfamily endonuclease